MCVSVWYTGICRPCFAVHFLPSLQNVSFFHQHCPPWLLNMVLEALWCTVWGHALGNKVQLGPQVSHMVSWTVDMPGCLGEIICRYLHPDYILSEWLNALNSTNPWKTTKPFFKVPSHVNSPINEDWCHYARWNHLNICTYGPYNLFF